MERVNHPPYYAWLKEKIGVEPIDIASLYPYNIGTALVYILRAGKKLEEGISPKDKKIEDLQKAIFHLQDEIKKIQDEKT